MKAASERPPSSELVVRFGVESALARGAISAFYRAFRASSGEDTRARFRRFRALASAIEPRAAVALSRIGERCGASRARPAELYFAIQTYIAVVLDRLSALVAPTQAPASPRDEAELFSWALGSGDEGAATSVAAIERALRSLLAGSPGALAEAGDDVTKPLYESLIPGAVRRQFGEYYTPRWLAEHVLGELGYDGDPGARILDPACGSGIFLLGAIRRIRARCEASGRAPGEALAAILRAVVGLDRSPLAVIAAKTNYLLAVADLLSPGSRPEIPVYLADSIVGAPGVVGDRVADDAGRFDYIAGNPPWINWSSLPPSYRRRAAPLFRRYGLFPHKGLRARSGAAMDDIASLLTYRSLDRHLKDGGRLGFVITQSVFKTEGGGEGFRRFSLPSGVPIRAVSVSDVSAIQPFVGAVSRTATVVLTKGEATTYPVPYAVWRPRRPITPELTYKEVMARVDVLRRAAAPICAEKPASPWIVAAPAALSGAERCLGASPYKARYGTHCYANGVYWVEPLAALDGHRRLVRNKGSAGKKKFASIERPVDERFLHRLARGRDVRRWSVSPSCWIVLPQDAASPSKAVAEVALRDGAPDTYRYLHAFESELRARSGYKKFFRPGVDPFYSVYNVGEYTFAKYKVVWREVAKDLRSAVIDGDREPAVPDHTLVSVAAASLDEAHYLCAALNSLPCNFIVMSYVTLHPGPHVLSYIRVPRYDPAEAEHARLARLSMECHEAARAGEALVYEEALAGRERAIDEAAARLWGLSDAELSALREGLSAMKPGIRGPRR